MFKVGQAVCKDDIFAAGWIIESFSVGMTDIVFVNEEETMCVTFNGHDSIGTIQKYVCKELI